MTIAALTLRHARIVEVPSRVRVDVEDTEIAIECTAIEHALTVLFTTGILSAVVLIVAEKLRANT